jgi:copper chaperone CopZ
MKSFILLTFLASSLSFAETKTIAVNGMTCGNCVKSITKAVCDDLKYSKENCTVKIGEVTVTGENIDMNAITAAVKKAGYEVAANDKTATAATAATTTPETKTEAKTPAKKKK